MVRMFRGACPRWQGITKVMVCMAVLGASTSTWGADVPGPDDLTQPPLQWGSAVSIPSLDYVRYREQGCSAKISTIFSAIEAVSPVDQNADWDFVTAEVESLIVWAWAEPMGVSNSFAAGSPTLQIFTPTGLIIISPIGSPLAASWGQWLRLSIPLSSNAEWTRTDYASPDLTHVRWVKLVCSTTVNGSRLWLDGFKFSASAPPPPPGFSPNVYWSGPGGDIWNTNSSPYEVDASNPFAVLWSSTSQEGHLHRPSGIVLADVEASGTPYLFGSTGWWQNGAYRRHRTTGGTSTWTTQAGQNDSGTGFRIALSLDGSALYHIDINNQIRAYPTGTDPNGVPLWTADGPSQGLTNIIKVGPGGRIYGNNGGEFVGAGALDPDTGQTVWSVYGGISAYYPGAFWQVGSTYQYVIAGNSCIVRAYDIAQPFGYNELWSYCDAEAGYAPPTIDPATGNIYVFRTRRLLKLNASGIFQWRSAYVGTGENGRSYGALSRDGQTYYYQTGSDANTGKLYAFRTSDGSIKWTFPTGARARIDGGCGGPVVSANGMIFVANGAHDAAPGDNRIFCIEDSAGVAPVLRGTFDLRNEGDVGGPWISIGPGGVVYFDAYATPDDPRMFACQSHEVTLPNPIQQRAFALNHNVRVMWAPVADTGSSFDKYLIYRDTGPFESVAGMTPVGEVTTATIGEYTDATAENGISYWYAVTTRTTSNAEGTYVTGVGPRTPCDDTDYQVVTIARTPRYPRYSPTYSWYMQTDPSGFGPYGFSAATGLGDGQTPETLRWPSIGDVVTYTAVVRNRGTNGGAASITGTWVVDGGVASVVQRSATSVPGDTLCFDFASTWDGNDHAVEFSFTMDQPESRAGNNHLAVTAKSVGFLTYVDQTHAEVFREESGQYPQAAANDIIDWLNHHMSRFNDMFAEAGSPKRVHYEVLEIIDDFLPDPPIDRSPFAVFPFRLHWDEANYRHTGWYRDNVDIDYGLLHEEGHQLGFIDLYLLNMWWDQNQVTGALYMGPTCLMNGCSEFLSEHTAGAATHWLDTAQGYFGQYLYRIPTTVKLKLLGHGGEPLDGAVATVYQRAERPGGQFVITDQVRAQVTAGSDGIATLPNVPVDPAVVPQAFNGDTLHDNPFGYVAVLGTNGLFLIKVEYEGFTDWCWLDIIEVNNAFAAGNQSEAIFERHLHLGGDISRVPPADMAEANAGHWAGTSLLGQVQLTDDPGTYHTGSSAVKIIASAGIDYTVRFPGDQLALWNVSQATSLRAWFYDLPNQPPYQEHSPIIRLNCTNGSIVLRPDENLLNRAEGQWYEVVAPLAGGNGWERMDYGSPSLNYVTSVEYHWDTWGGDPHTLWIDGVNFDPPVTTGIPATTPRPILSLEQNEPNPFNPQTVIRYELVSRSSVRLRVYNTRGALICTLVDEPQEPGSHVVTWNGRDDRGHPAAVGAYFYTLESDGNRLTKKMMLVK